MPCDMRSIQKITKKYNLKLIEDCSQAHGAKYFNKFVGSFGDIAVWSFCNDKIISTLGEGGMIASKTYESFKNIWSIKEIGKDYLLTNTKEKPSFKWVHNNLGTNMRMTEIQAGVGRIQLKSLKKNVKRRRQLANIFQKELSNSKLFQFPSNKTGYYNSFYKVYLFINDKFLKKQFTRSSIISLLKEQKIKFTVGSCPEIYKEKLFKKVKLYKELPNANFVGKISIAFSVNQFQEPNYIIKVCKVLKDMEKKFLN